MKKQQKEEEEEEEEEEEDKKEQKEEEQDNKNEEKIKLLNDFEIKSIVSSIDNNNLLNGNEEKVISLLSTINDWNFSVFEFVEICNNLSLSLLMITICKSIHNDIMDRLSVPMDILINYMNLVDINYLHNPY